MPCDQVRNVKLKFNQKTDLAILKKTLEALGYKVQIKTAMTGQETLTYSYAGSEGKFNQRTGDFEHTSRMSFNLAKLGEEYQRQSIITQAENNGWEWEWIDPEKTEMDIFRQRI